jgi:hypothetical protein
MGTEHNDNFEIAAYHESGHITIAYFSGYSCDSVELLESDPGSGRTMMNYGRDRILIASLLNIKEDPNFFNELDGTTKAEGPAAAQRMTTILLVGSAAEAIYKNGGMVNGNMEVEVSGPDLNSVDNLHYFLSQIDRAHSPNFVDEQLHFILQMLSHPKIWSAIECLAQEILRSPNKTLKESDIHMVLKNNGFFEFLGTL